MALIDDVKDVLRESGADSETEIQDLIDAAKDDLRFSGVIESKITDDEPLIKRAINLYCKAHFSYEDPKQGERFESAYEGLKNHLCLSIEFTEGTT